MGDVPWTERRREPRHGVSLPVWWRGPGQVNPGHGWMLDISGHGAAMLTPQENAPAVGDRLTVSLVDPATGPHAGVAQYLLSRATVHRVDPIGRTLGRVALYFDDELWRHNAPPQLDMISGLLKSKQVH